MTVAITRTEHTAADLRRLAGGSDDAAAARRLLTLVLDRRRRADAARLGWTGKPCATGCTAATPTA